MSLSVLCCDGAAMEWVKGLIMRIDMPGEEKFGLDFMDLYYEGIRNRKTYNVGQSLIGKGHKGVMKRGQLKDLARVREKMFRGTRIVLDPLTVVDNKTLYEQRGWLQWDKQSAAAERSLLKKMAEDKLPVAALNGGAGNTKNIMPTPRERHFTSLISILWTREDIRNGAQWYLVTRSLIKYFAEVLLNIAANDPEPG
ncbi:hypothetical protein M7I_0416 [Glarea lozoyensis 74030]|uniref:Uncharacterized protein n=1 Tax=Glarea lozoyensis (strain ATCC 74030 / MF5533) TaxID=1104152 RepID=H0EDB1_GLAL7|nr:hypothetical protein M7I_0416 [Glarea lozoyensis 74030]